MINAMSKVMTVSGPIERGDLGVTDAHEHLFLRSPALAGEELDDPGRAIEEVSDAHAIGLAAIVELTPIGLGRQPELLRRVAAATGVAIVGATGYHRDAHYAPGHWVSEASETQLIERMVIDIEQGMHPADWHDPDLPLDAARAGVIKAGASYHRVSPTERRRLAAAGEAGRRTGVPIVVHTEVGTAAHDIVELLTAAGVAAEAIILAHLDRNPDPELHLELAERGVYLVYDTVGRIKYQPDSTLLALIETVCNAGHGDQLMLGLDLGRRAYFRAHGGGPGLRYLLASFAPRLERRIGVGAARRILVDNPARAYSLREATGAGQ